MKDPFKFQYKSPNLARLQEIFVNDTHLNFKTNYTITNKAVMSPFKLSSKDSYNNYEIISNTITSNKKENIPKASFVKKYNKVLNEFCIPKGKKFITVDLDEKLKLNYLKFKIDESKINTKNLFNYSTKSKINNVKHEFLFGDHKHFSTTNNNLNKIINSFDNTKICKSPSKENVKCSSISETNYNVNIKKKFNNKDSKNAYLKYVNQATSPASKANYTKKEIINSLFDEPNRPLTKFKKIHRLRGSSSFEKNLRKKVILSGILNFNSL